MVPGTLRQGLNSKSVSTVWRLYFGDRFCPIVQSCEYLTSAIEIKYDRHVSLPKEGSQASGGNEFRFLLVLGLFN